MGLSFSAAPLVFLAAAAWTGIIAPDLLLFLLLGSGGLDVCKLFQKAKAYCLAGHLHCEDLLAEVLNINSPVWRAFRMFGPREIDLKRSSGGVICIISSGV